MQPAPKPACDHGAPALTQRPAHDRPSAMRTAASASCCGRSARDRPHWTGVVSRSSKPGNLAQTTFGAVADDGIAYFLRDREADPGRSGVIPAQIGLAAPAHALDARRPLLATRRNSARRFRRSGWPDRVQHPDGVWRHRSIGRVRPIGACGPWRAGSPGLCVPPDRGHAGTEAVAALADQLRRLIRAFHDELRFRWCGCEPRRMRRSATGQDMMRAARPGDPIADAAYSWSRPAKSIQAELRGP